MEKTSIISQLSELSKNFNSENSRSFGVIGLDLNDNQPGNLFINFKGSPHETLGMIEHMISILKDHKKMAQRSLDEHYGNKENLNNSYKNSEKRLEELLENLPEDLVKKVKELEERMRTAFEEGDVKKMIQVKNDLIKLKDEYNNGNLDSNESDEKNNDNDINDFK